MNHEGLWVSANLSSGAAAYFFGIYKHGLFEGAKGSAWKAHFLLLGTLFTLS